MIRLKDFVRINGGGDYSKLPDEDKAYWEFEWHNAMKYDMEEEKGKDFCKYGEE